jgi:hypothetical protein
VVRPRAVILVVALLAAAASVVLLTRNPDGSATRDPDAKAVFPAALELVSESPVSAAARDDVLAAIDMISEIESPALR